MSWLLKPFGSSKKQTNGSHTGSTDAKSTSISGASNTSPNTTPATSSSASTHHSTPPNSQYYFESTATTSAAYIGTKTHNKLRIDPEYGAPQPLNNGKTRQHSKPVTPASTTDTTQHTLSTPTRNIKLNKFHKLLSAETVDLTALRKLAWSGVPSSIRADVWKLLLGYWPTNTSRRAQTIDRRYSEYQTYVQQYFGGAGGGGGGQQMMTRSQTDSDILHQVKLDVPRTSASSPLFQSPQLQQSLVQLLYIWSVRHPASGYVQGINDLAIPFYIVCMTQLTGADDVHTVNVSAVTEQQLSHMECDVYWCLSSLLDTIHDHYTFAQPGIQRMVYKLQELVQRIDAPLYKHMDDNGIQFIQFAFRWVNCLLLRELPTQLCIRLWDTYISEDVNAAGFKQFHVYVCAALLIRFSAQLQAMDFQQMIVLLQNLPTQQWQIGDIDTLLAQAYVYQSWFTGAKQI